MAFETDSCPDGWNSYPDGAGRFLLGAGDSRDIKNTKKYHVTDTGGLERVVLKRSEMPRHRHEVEGKKVLLVEMTGKDTTTGVDNNEAHEEFNVRIGVQMGEAGEDQPHENMPPFRVVTFCMKP